MRNRWVGRFKFRSLVLSGIFPLIAAVIMPAGVSLGVTCNDALNPRKSNQSTPAGEAPRFVWSPRPDLLGGRQPSQLLSHSSRTLAESLSLRLEKDGEELVFSSGTNEALREVLRFAPKDRVRIVQLFENSLGFRHFWRKELYVSIVTASEVFAFRLKEPLGQAGPAERIPSRDLPENMFEGMHIWEITKVRVGAERESDPYGKSVQVDLVQRSGNKGLGATRAYRDFLPVLRLDGGDLNAQGLKGRIFRASDNLGGAAALENWLFRVANGPLYTPASYDDIYNVILHAFANGKLPNLERFQRSAVVHAIHAALEDPRWIRDMQDRVRDLSGGKVRLDRVASSEFKRHPFGLAEYLKLSDGTKETKLTLSLRPDPIEVDLN